MAQVKVFTSGNPDSLNIHYHFPGLGNDHNRSKEVLSACSAQMFNIAFNYAGDEPAMRAHTTYKNFIDRIDDAASGDALKEILETFENNVSNQTRGGVPQGMPSGPRKRVFSFHSAGFYMFRDLAESGPSILLPSEGLVQGALHLDDLYSNSANEAMIRLAEMGLKQTIVNNASGDGEAQLPTLQSTENIKFIQTDTSHGSIPVEYINGETTALFS